MNKNHIKYIEDFKGRWKSCERWEDVLLTEYRKERNSDDYELKDLDFHELLIYLTRMS